MTIVEILIMWVSFPVAIIWGCKILPNHEYNMQIPSINDSMNLRGIAAIMVVFAHYTAEFENQSGALGILYPFSRLGPLGVGVFFFLSSYGLSVSKSPRDWRFLFRRVKNVLFPYFTIQLLFCIFQMVFLRKEFSIQWIMTSLFVLWENWWYLCMILIMYAAYWIIWKINWHSVYMMYGFSILIYFIMYFAGMGEYWYATNICFPLGITFALHKNFILGHWRKHYPIWVVSFILLFGVSILFYDKSGLGISVLGKTAASVCLSLLACLFTMKIRINSKMILWAGKLSLHIYISHPLIMSVLHDFDYPIRTIVLLICTAIVSLGVYLLLKPIDKFNVAQRTG